MTDETTTLTQDTTEVSTSETTETVDTTEDKTATEETTETTDTTETSETTEDTKEADTSEETKDEKTEDEDEIEYTDFTFAEGVDVNESAMEVAVPKFKELGLDQEQAQGVIDLFQDVSGMSAERAAKDYSDQVETYTTEIKTVWGDKFEDNLKVSAKATDYFDKLLREQLPEDKRTADGENGNSVPVTPFRDALNVTGAGNHPAIIQAIHHFATLISEDGVADTVRPNGQTKTVAEEMYPSHYQST
ncbi:MAG: hypothetical protein AAF583_01610 [Pseudomonadota bacterium]